MSVLAAIEAIQRDGYVRLHAEDFIGASAYNRLVTAANERHAQPPPVETLGPVAASKTTRTRWLGIHPVFDPVSIWAQTALETPIRTVAEAYVPKATLAHYNLWQTVATTAPPSHSELWHRDAEDPVMLKAFLYLSDVTSDTGPLWYLPGTHRRGWRGAIKPAQTLIQGVARTTDAQMAAMVPASEWVALTGPAGTLILADTAGFHKGGYVTQGERWLYTCQFTSPYARMQPFLPLPAIQHADPWQSSDAYRDYTQAQVGKTLRMQQAATPQRTWRLLTALRPYLVPQGQAVLCIGCRNLHELRMVRDAGYVPTGIDLVAGHPEILPMDFHRLGFPDATFDAVFACHSLEHAYDIPTALAEWARVLKPGGYWAIEVPTHFTPTAIDRWDCGDLAGLRQMCQPLTKPLFGLDGDDFALVIARKPS